MKDCCLKWQNGGIEPFKAEIALGCVLALSGSICGVAFGQAASEPNATIKTITPNELTLKPDNGSIVTIRKQSNLDIKRPARWDDLKENQRVRYGKGRSQDFVTLPTQSSDANNNRKAMDGGQRTSDDFQNNSEGSSTWLLTIGLLTLGATGAGIGLIVRLNKESLAMRQELRQWQEAQEKRETSATDFTNTSGVLRQETALTLNEDINILGQQVSLIGEQLRSVNQQLIALPRRATVEENPPSGRDVSTQKAQAGADSGPDPRAWMKAVTRDLNNLHELLITVREMTSGTRSELQTALRGSTQNAQSNRSATPVGVAGVPPSNGAGIKQPNVNEAHALAQGVAGQLLPQIEAITNLVDERLTQQKQAFDALLQEREPQHHDSERDDTLHEVGSALASLRLLDERIGRLLSQQEQHEQDLRMQIPEDHVEEWARGWLGEMEVTTRRFRGNASVFAREQAQVMRALLELSDDLQPCNDDDLQEPDFLSRIDRVVFRPPSSVTLVEVEALPDEDIKILAQIESVVLSYRRWHRQWLENRQLQVMAIVRGETIFNPDDHEDNQHDRRRTKDPQQANIILRVIENGYLWRGNVVRKALVRRLVYAPLEDRIEENSTPTVAVLQSQSEETPEAARTILSEEVQGSSVTLIQGSQSADGNQSKPEDDGARHKEPIDHEKLIKEIATKQSRNAG